MFSGRTKGPLGSHARPASALGLRLILALFGFAVCTAATAMAVFWWHSAPVAVIFGFGMVLTAVNSYWVAERIRYERR
ncbi:hypothetical protein J4H86_15295 [Spiractinospora alimapuensis]|uniref:hypothetical protein n=1 Tax=Spiractinospora alimapuensis TaxID=2820884 RepID=UPI001F3D533E|nr:hypothetical protein [Spiractinospora alimapuensis]QVQ50312.1 hypothetical protein J4H86_15295 [Spiractinospora alimapuensis]